MRDTDDNPPKKRRLWIILAALLLVYFASYYVLSRRGFRFSDRVNAEGFYFFPPDNSTSWRIRNNGLVLLYYPLILGDRIVGTGRAPAPSSVRPGEVRRPALAS